MLAGWEGGVSMTEQTEMLDRAGISNENDEWYTPAWVFEALGTTFDLDPCSPGNPPSTVPAGMHLTKDDNGLNYICATYERFYAVGTVLSNMVAQLVESQTARLLKHVVRCFLRYAHPHLAERRFNHSPWKTQC